MPKSLWLYLVIGLAVLAARMALQPPQPLSATAAMSEFSAQRALVDVRAIAQKPHPIGSEEEARVRAYLMARLSALGLNAEIHVGQGVYIPRRGGGDAIAAGSVQNLIGGVKGVNPTAPALLIMSHYDSVRNSPGAADDSAGVAAALEIARMVQSGPRPLRDVIFLFTDGEEAGLLGAQAFFADDPLAKRVGFVINMESRGGGGLAQMFETGRGQGALMGLYQGAVSRPSAMSLSAAIYRHMPNGTDFTEALNKGLPGLNFAFVDDQLAYHTPLATPKRLELASLQHMGDQAGAMTRILAAAANLPEQKTDAVYGDLFGRYLIAYPTVWGWGVIACGLVLALIGIGFAARAQRLSPTVMVLDALRGAAVLVAWIAASALGFELIGQIYHLADYATAYAALVHGEALMAGIVLTGLGLLTAFAGGAAGGKGRMAATLGACFGMAACCLVLRGLDTVAVVLGLTVILFALIGLRKPVGAAALWGGGLILTGLLAVTVQAIEPLAASFFAWPFLAGAAISALVAGLGKGDGSRSPGLLVVAVLALPVSAQILVWGANLFTAVGVNLPAANLLSLIALSPVVAPLAWAAGRGPVGRMLAGLSLLGGLVGFCWLISPPTSDRPGLTQAFFVADPDQGQDLIASRLPLEPWSQSVLALDGGKSGRGEVEPLLPAGTHVASAHLRDIPGPQLDARRTSGRLLLKMAPSRQGETLILYLKPSTGLSHVSLNGRTLAFSAKAGVWSRISYEAPPPEGVTLALDAPESGRVELAAAEIRTGWPAGVTPPQRPANRMAWSWSDTTIALTRRTASW